MKRVCSVLILVWALAGCAAVPTSGPVVHYEQQHRQLEGGVEIAAEPPAPGASPLLIVEGFLHSMATYQPGYNAARQYLTSKSAASWDPSTGVEIFGEGSPALSGSGNEVVLRSRLTGNVDSRGTYSARNADYEHSFGLVKEGGEWRISRPPTGILISQYLFRNAYTNASLYYLDQSFDTLIPDAVVVPRGLRELTPIAKLLVGTPSSWLAPVARSAVSADAGISVESVSVLTGGTISVELSDNAQSLDTQTRSRLAAQFTWTLTQFDQATGVRFTSQGNDLRIPEADRDGIVRESSLSRFNPVPDNISRQLYGLHEGRIAKITQESANLRAAQIDWAPASITGFAVDSQSLHAAVVAGDQLQTNALTGGTPQILLTRSGLVRPQYSRDSELWVAGGSGVSGGFAVWRDGVHVPVSAPGLDGRTVQAFRISADGTRIALIVSSMDHVRVAVMRVERDTNAITLSGWSTVEIGSGLVPRDIGWIEDSTLMISYDSGATAGVVTTDIAGALVTDQNLPSSRTGLQIAASLRDSEPEAMVCDSEGQCTRFVSSDRWVSLSGTVTLPVYPS